ncbi:hypothetical protein E3G68_005290 [Mycobacteroides abscessus]|uniref:hypothetical protein n=1 Tax=Mycobacteroides abscessus TaxID=36809 RepID=UPI00187797F4|nr:hypothetical protein [Mycobacteroides abscessus]
MTTDVPVFSDDDGRAYLWSDLVARRVALGLQTEQSARAMKVSYEDYDEIEEGEKPPDPQMVESITAMEQFVAQETDLAVAAGTGGKAVWFTAVADQDAFNQMYPQARTPWGTPYPFTLQHVAIGRAAGELSRRGIDVEVFGGPQGDRRVDLAVRRQAVGLLKTMASDLLGIPQKRYYKWEAGIKWAPGRAGDPTGASVPAGLIAEMQALDDFIVLTAAELPVEIIDGVSVVYMLDDQAEFEQVYPQARTLRDRIPYPIRIHRVAAARRASSLASAGHDVRIAVED